MKKTYCDLCKKEIEFPKYKFLIRTDNGCTINSITSIMDGIEYDLCDECKEKIMTYVNDIRRGLSGEHREMRVRYWYYK